MSSSTVQPQEKAIEALLKQQHRMLTVYRKQYSFYVESFYGWVCKHLGYHTSKASSSLFVVGYGSIYFVDLGINIGSEQNKLRPCVVISRKRSNNGDTVTVIPLTSSKPSSPMCVRIKPTAKNNLSQESRALPSQIRTVSKKRFAGYCGTIDDSDIKILQEVVARYLGLSIEKQKTPHKEMSL